MNCLTLFGYGYLVFCVIISLNSGVYPVFNCYSMLPVLSARLHTVYLACWTTSWSYIHGKKEICMAGMNTLACSHLMYRKIMVRFPNCLYFGPNNSQIHSDLESHTQKLNLFLYFSTSNTQHNTNKLKIPNRRVSGFLGKHYKITVSAAWLSYDFITF